MYPWDTKLCLYAYSTFVWMQEAVSLEWKLIFFTCLTFFTKILPLTLELPIQEHSWDFSWPFLDPQKYVRDRTTRNVSSLKKVSVVFSLLYSRESNSVINP